MENQDHWTLEWTAVEKEGAKDCRNIWITVTL